MPADEDASPTVDALAPDLVGLGADVQWPDVDVTAAPATDRLGALRQWAAATTPGADDYTRARLVILGDSPPPVDMAELAGLSIRGHGAELQGGAATGVALVDDEVDSGADLLVVAVPGAEVAALTAISVLTNTEPVKVLPRGTALTTQQWTAQAEAVRDGRLAAFAHRNDPAALLTALRAPTLACASALLLRAAGRRTPTVLDGLGAVGAAVVAHAIAPRAAHWWQVADRGHHPAIDLATVKLGITPILDLGITAADGTAGALATLVLRASLRTGPRRPA